MDTKEGRKKHGGLGRSTENTHEEDEKASDENSRVAHAREREEVHSGGEDEDDGTRRTTITRRSKVFIQMRWGGGNDLGGMQVRNVHKTRTTQ